MFGIKSPRKWAVANAVTLLFLGSHVILFAGLHATTAPKVKVKVQKIVPVDAKQTYSGVAVQLHSFLTPALNGSGQNLDQ